MLIFTYKYPPEYTNPIPDTASYCVVALAFLPTFIGLVWNTGCLTAGNILGSWALTLLLSFRYIAEVECVFAFVCKIQFTLKFSIFNFPDTSKFKKKFPIHQCIVLNLGECFPSYAQRRNQMHCVYVSLSLQTCLQWFKISFWMRLLKQFVGVGWKYSHFPFFSELCDTSLALIC